MIINKVVTSGPALSVPSHLSFAQFVIDKLRVHCEDDAVAIINGDTNRKITYKQILQETVNVATGLKKLGVKRGDVVALCSENRDEFIPTAVAVLCCGATLTTLNVQYTKEETKHVLNISRPKIMFASEEGLQNNLEMIKSASSIKKIIQLNGKPVAKSIIEYKSVGIETNPYEYEPEEVQGWTDVGYILYSSGTTGLPKGVMLTHLNLLYSASSFDQESPIPELTLLTIVPWYHAYGLMTTINYIATRKRLVYLNGFNPLKYLSTIQEYKVHGLAAVPPIVVFLAKAPIVEKYDLSSIMFVFCGAAPLSSETITLAMKRMPNCIGIFQAYGMTETSLAATRDNTDLQTGIEQKPGSGGYPLLGVKAKVVDIETREKLGPNEKGEICLKGPIIMKGYAGDEAATRAVFDDEGFMKTGDIGYYDKDGCFFIVDRLKELIKYKGYQVAPAAVESVLLEHPDVAESGVVGAPDEAAGELPTAFVVRKPGATVTEKQLQEFTAPRLSTSSQLRGGIIFIDQLPKSPSGKILRRVLKQQLLQRQKSKL